MVLKNYKLQITNYKQIQPRTTKEFSEIQHPLVVLGWVAQYPLVVLGKTPNPK